MIEDTKKIKRTHTFDRMLLKRLETAAKHERRAVSEQLAIFLEEALAKFEKAEKPGNMEPATA